MKTTTGTTEAHKDVIRASHIHDDAFHAWMADANRRFQALTEDRSTKLFVVDTNRTAPDVPHTLYDLYLSSFDDLTQRQAHTCNCCRQFIERFGSLVIINEDGWTRSALWDTAPQGFYAAAVNLLRTRVENSKVTGVFNTAERQWGTPVTGMWSHIAFCPPMHLVHQRFDKAAYEVSAAKREDYLTMVRALEEFKRTTVDSAVAILNTETFRGSHHVIGPAKWLQEVMTQRANTLDSRLRHNLLWRAVALAPDGFTHPRTSMIGTLLEDLENGLSVADAQRKFEAKMHPLKYQRPQAPAAQGTIAQAEKLFEKMDMARSLDRRFATLADILKVWTPKTAGASVQVGGSVFGHLKPKGETAQQTLTSARQTMTWEKFCRTILPVAEKIQIHAPMHNGAYAALTTAVHADAKPILQWDREDNRNPVAWYLYHNGSSASKWNLHGGIFHDVTAVSLSPQMWSGRAAHDNQANGVFFIIKGAKDTSTGQGNALFPSCLRHELHGVRAVIEQYSKDAKLYGFDEASACGLVMHQGKSGGITLRVTIANIVQEIHLDRWD